MTQPNELDPLALYSELLKLTLREGERLVGQLGTYVVKREFGAGGQGRVYRATREGDGVEALLKLPRATDGVVRDSLTELREVATAEFTQEYESFVDISSRALARDSQCARFPEWIDTGTYSWNPTETSHVDVPFLAFQFIEGRTLYDWRSSDDFKFDFATFLNIAEQIANGIAVIHETGHVHGDLHPRNLILSQGDSPGSWTIYFIDFGLSSNLVQDLWLRTRLGGAGPYMAPEIPATKVSDERSDIWSLGAVLFFLLKGRHPNIVKLEEELQRQGGRRSGSLLDHHKYLIERTLRASHPGLIRLNPGIVDMVCRCLRPKVEERTGSAEAALFDLNLCRSPREILPAKPEESLKRIEDALPSVFLDSTNGDIGIMGHIASVILENTAAEFGSLRNGFITLRGDHEAIVRYMCSFLGLLEEGDQYLTLTFPRFWDESNLGIHGRYLSLNRAAAARGVTIKRVLVVDEAEFSNRDSLSRRVTRAHRESILDCLLVSNEDPSVRINVIDKEKDVEKPGYHTVVHFASTEHHDRLLHESRNCALWRRKGQNLVITPLYVGDSMRGLRLMLMEDTSKFDELFGKYYKQSTSIIDLTMI